MYAFKVCVCVCVSVCVLKCYVVVCKNGDCPDIGIYKKHTCMLAQAHTHTHASVLAYTHTNRERGRERAKESERIVSFMYFNVLITI